MGTKIPAETTLRALDAVAFFNDSQGQAFNGMVTINFEQLGLNTESETKHAVRRLNEGISKLITRHSEHWRYPATHTYLYVHEDVATSHGHHLHELVKIPRGLAPELPAWLSGWARRNFGDVPQAAVHYRHGWCATFSRAVTMSASLQRVANRPRCITYSKWLVTPERTAPR